MIPNALSRFHARMPQARQASVEFALRLQSADAQHTHRRYFEKVNFWRDFFPGTLGDQLAALPAAGRASESFAAGDLVEPWNASVVHRVRPEQIKLALRTGTEIPPRTGHYPRGMISGLPDVFAGDRRPCRYLGETDGWARVDLNHPLARYALSIEGHIDNDLGVTSERGGAARTSCRT